MCCFLLCCACRFAAAQSDGISNVVSFQSSNSTLFAHYSDFAKSYVEMNINVWQKKGEFEKLEDYRERVNDLSRNQKVQELTQEAERVFINQHSQRIFFSDLKIIGLYDAENEVYMIQSSMFGTLLVPVPISVAPKFKDYWNNISTSAKPHFFIDHDTLALASLTFLLDNKKYSYNNQASLNYVQQEIDYHFEPIVISDKSSVTSTTRGNQNIGSNTVVIGKADVDLDIPTSNYNNEKTFVLIFANENYKRVDMVPYAHNDGFIFSQYCLKTLNIPQNNVHYVQDATLNDLRAEVKWLKEVLISYQGEAQAIIYYSGHGMPDDKTATAYLLPVDGFGTDVSTGYSLQLLYNELASVPAKRLTYFIDACFSGSKREGDMIAEARGLVIKVKPDAIGGNAVVFAAASGDETAFPYPDKQHGIFTYFLLKKLQETNANVSYGDLQQYIQTNVQQTSSVIWKKQTPTIKASNSVSEDWRTWKFYE